MKRIVSQHFKFTVIRINDQSEESLMIGKREEDERERERENYMKLLCICVNPNADDYYPEKFIIFFSIFYPW